MRTSFFVNSHKSLGEIGQTAFSAEGGLRMAPEQPSPDNCRGCSTLVRHELELRLSCLFGGTLQVSRHFRNRHDDLSQ